MNLKITSTFPATCQWPAGAVLLAARLCLAMACCLAVPGRAEGIEAAQPGPALAACLGRMAEAVDQAELLLPELGRAADRVAQRWVDGLQLHVAGDDCATDEAFYRAGSLIGMRRIGKLKKDKNGQQVTWSDVPARALIIYVLHRNSDPDLILFEDLQRLLAKGDTVVLFGSSNWLACRRVVETLRADLGPERFFFLDTGLAQDTALRTSRGIRYGETAGMATTAHLWTFFAEVVAACSRRQRMPTIWPSGAIPQYSAWEQTYGAVNFHDDLRIPPIEAGVLGQRYLQALRRQLHDCTGSASQVAAAARTLAAVPDGKGVYVMVESHLLAGETSFPSELPDWVLVQRSWRWNRAKPSLKAGDGVLWLGTFDWPVEAIASAQALPAVFVAATLHGPNGAPQHTPLAEAARITVEPPPPTEALATPGALWVPTPWQYPDAVVELDPYPLPICPTSSVINGVLLWSIIGTVLEVRAPAGAASGPP
jgi:hypothetical protein